MDTLLLRETNRLYQTKGLESLGVTGKAFNQEAKLIEREEIGKKQKQNTQKFPNNKTPLPYITADIPY